jgi:glycosyltransferase involved in cell wall biosynthesis
MPAQGSSPRAPAAGVSVAVTAYNAERDLPGLLAALDRQTLSRERFEVVIGDDGSSDGTAEIAGSWPGVRLVRADERQGEAATRNLAVAAGAAPVVAIADADCRPLPEWLEHGLADLDALEVDLLGGEVRVRAGERPSLAALIDVARHLDQRAAVEEAGYAVTANLFARRHVFDAVGPFTPGLRAGVDVEWVLRATAAGFRLAYSPRAAVEHPPQRRARDLARKAYRDGYGTGQFRFRARGPLAGHGPAWRAPDSWRPARGIARTERLRLQGHALGSRRALALDVAHYAQLQLPFIAGSAVATLRRGRF